MGPETGEERNIPFLLFYPATLSGGALNFWAVPLKCAAGHRQDGGMCLGGTGGWAYGNKPVRGGGGEGGVSTFSAIWFARSCIKALSGRVQEGCIRGRAARDGGEQGGENEEIGRRDDT